MENEEIKFAEKELLDLYFLAMDETCLEAKVVKIKLANGKIFAIDSSAFYERAEELLLSFGFKEVKKDKTDSKTISTNDKKTTQELP